MKGTLGGQLTIGDDNNINGDIKYSKDPNARPSTDVLGLVAFNNIVIQRSTNGNGSPWPGTCHPNMTIDAALVALKHSIYVANRTTGMDMGMLWVNGTLAQDFRGAVGAGSAVYWKGYVWDIRLRYLSPTFFIDAVKSSWEHISFGEQPATATP